MVDVTGGGVVVGGAPVGVAAVVGGAAGVGIDLLGLLRPLPLVLGHS